MLALLLGGLLDRAALARMPAEQPEARRRTAAAAVSNATTPERGFMQLPPRLAASAETRVVPIRFPAVLHEELRAWCEEHGFPMAAVVRGLTERFLDSQRSADAEAPR